MAYKDKEKQKQVQRDWVRQKRANAKGSTEIKRTIADACGVEHPIDFEGRRQRYAMLESWARGEGTEYQQTLGLLNRHYTIIKSKAELNHYLGLPDSTPEPALAGQTQEIG